MKVMPEAKCSYHHGDLRNALVATATELVRASGAENFGLREAAKRLGVSANATYRHFDSKSALLAEVANVAGEKLGQKMRRKVTDVRRHAGAADGALAVEVLKATGRAYFAFAIEEPQLYRVIHGPNGICTTMQGRSPDPATYSLAQVVMEDALDGLVASGVLTSEKRVDGSVRLWTVFHGFASLVIDGATHFVSVAHRTRALESLLDFAIRGLGVELEHAKRRNQGRK